MDNGEGVQISDEKKEVWVFPDECVGMLNEHEKMRLKLIECKQMLNNISHNTGSIGALEKARSIDSLLSEINRVT